VLKTGGTSDANVPPAGRAGSRHLVALVFLLLAGLMWADPWPHRSPVEPMRVVPAWVVDTAPVRQPSMRPEIQIAGYTYRCSECHDLFPSPKETFRELTQHQHIRLEHGINTRCFNCHHIVNRDAFVDDWGNEIPWNEPPRLCAKCHGPVYRDWLHGSHGRSNGYWDTSRGPQERRKCIECHDPHEPPFPPMSPAPPPNTLRMGDQRVSEEHPAIPDPLRVYQQPGAEGNRAHEPGHDPRDAGLGGPALQDSRHAQEDDK